MPLALAVLAANPLAGALYDGELLVSLKGVPSAYWPSMLLIEMPLSPSSSGRSAHGDQRRCPRGLSGTSKRVHGSSLLRSRRRSPVGYLTVHHDRVFGNVSHRCTDTLAAVEPPQGSPTPSSGVLLGTGPDEA